MRLGLDFDNTIVCYDEAFFQLARETDSIPASTPKFKEHVKAHLQAQGRNDYWTELQGLAYGPRMEVATPFPGAEKFIEAAEEAGIELFIVSHRSPKPYSGLDYDLHEAARNWLKTRPWVANGKIKPENIFFLAKKEEKIRKIASLNLDYFVDDLLEIFTHPEFPAHTKQVLFQPGAGADSSLNSLPRATVKSWHELLEKFQVLWKTNRSKA